MLIEVREAEPGDAGRVADIHAACFAKAWSKLDIERMLLAETNSSWVLTRNGDICAFAILMWAGDDVEILTIATALEWKRCGYAKQLLCACDNAFKNNSDEAARRWLLEVAVDNLPAIALYESLGFEQIAKRRNYYRREDGVNVDAFVFSAKIGNLGC
ncbi:GNAT family N-acetyltransferase [Hirschia litorea]|uniref:GNAT family N-acetyltransferase n=1 Tax=Hirschia litorea TaxID=1199156 RepID=A0ABW2INE7_9PROT